MTDCTAASFQLQYIQLWEQGGTSAAAPASFSLNATHVLLQVGAAGEDRSRAPSLFYRCPAFLAQRGATALRDMLEDLLEEEADGGSHAAGLSFPNVSGNGNANESVAAAASASPPAVIPLPFLSEETFQILAVYMEHFYGLSSMPVVATHGAATGSRSVEAGGTAAASATFTSSAAAPSVLRRPLNFEDLYGLSAWEHHFLLHSVFGLTWSETTTLGLIEEGRWVDLLGGALETRKRRDGAAETSEQGKVLSEAAWSLFTMARRQGMWRRATAVLEAATRLGMPVLRQLCAAVAANMTVDLNAEQLAQLMQPAANAARPAGQPRGIPPFTAEARAKLLQRFPWLSRETDAKPSAA